MKIAANVMVDKASATVVFSCLFIMVLIALCAVFILYLTSVKKGEE
jgi:hypothetical protein